MKKFEELFPLPAPEIVVVTGPYGSGKSTFTLGTGAAPERTLVIDFEKSQKSFAQQISIAYVDMQALLAAKFPAGYKPIQLFDMVVATVDEKLVPDTYDVMVLDNASVFEDAILAYVEAHSQEFGHSAGQYNSMSGLKWGDVKNKYSQLLTRWASSVKMIFVVVHLRDKWAGNTIVKDAFGRPVQEPKGKETLDQLSSLFVWLETGPGGIPAARVLKCRIDRKVYVANPDNPPADIPKRYIQELNGEPGLVSVPVLPLRLPKCTWAAIREYMRKSADLTHPKEGEMPTDAQMTEDDRLRLRAIITQNEAEKANAELVRIGQAGQHVEAKTQAALLQYGRSLGLEPTEVGDALKEKKLNPFNADNWDRMKEAVLEASQNKAQPETAAVTQPTTPASEEPKATQPANPQPATPAPAAANGNGSGPTRPYDPETLRGQIEARTRANQGKRIDKTYRNLIAPTLEMCFAGIPKAEQEKRRHKVQEFLTGYNSLTVIPDPTALALYAWLKPYKGASGGWLPQDTALAEAVKVWELISTLPEVMPDPATPIEPINGHVPSEADIPDFG